MTLKALGIEKDVYHCNEGHAALINIQRLCDYIAGGLDFGQAMELVRASSLYTVHTPVPAGHDYFDEGLFNKYMKGYPDKLGITWNNLMDLGRHNPGDKGERFCMSVFACKTSQEVNGVSLLHKTVSQEMFAPIWKGYFPEENHVGYVTNGVHFLLGAPPNGKSFSKTILMRALFMTSPIKNLGSCLRHSGRRNMEYPPETKNQTDRLYQKKMQQRLA